MIAPDPQGENQDPQMRSGMRLRFGRRGLGLGRASATGSDMFDSRSVMRGSVELVDDPESAVGAHPGGAVVHSGLDQARRAPR